MNTMDIFQTDYNYGDFEEKHFDSVCDSIADIPTNTIRWIHIKSAAEIESLDNLCEYFNFHPLIKRDILERNSRPKIDDYDDYIFTSINSVKFNRQERTFDTIKISIILGLNYVITYSNNSPEIFEAVKKRMEKYSSHLQRHGADYLYYFILDTLMDSYFAVLEEFSDRVDRLEDATLINPTKDSLHALQHMRRQILSLNKSFWPLREILSYLERGDATLISDPIKTYMRGLYEHIIQVIDTTESLRDLLSGVMDIYLSSVSNKMNEIMKVLTIISTIFIPITFITGLYGMNFVYMPELKFTYSYPIVLGIMVVIVFAMLYYFKKKKWL